MGAGSCNLIYFVNGSVAQTSVVPVGGQHFTHDIAVGLRTPQVSAEQLKVKFGHAMASLVAEDETVEVEGVGGRKSRVILRKDLADVIEPRAEECLMMIQNDLRMSSLVPFLGSGVVLTGGANSFSIFLFAGELRAAWAVLRKLSNQEVFRRPSGFCSMVTPKRNTPKHLINTKRGFLNQSTRL